MYKVYQDIVINKNGRILYKIECLECQHTSWIPRYKIDSTWLCPKCHNLGMLLNRISKRYFINDNGCHVWEGNQTKDGYAVITIKNKKVRVAKAVLENKIGRLLKEGYETCHTCNNRSCVNPDHLYEGTHKQNGIDLSKSKTMRGDNNPRARINETVATIIKRKILDGGSVAKIAQEFNVSISTVDNIKRE